MSKSKDISDRRDARGWSAQTTTAVAAVVIAAAALGLSIYEGRMGRRHDRLLLEPRLDFHSVLEEDRGRGTHVENLGLGPAVLDSMKGFVDLQEVPMTEPRHWKEFGDRLKAQCPSLCFEGVSGQKLARGYMLASGDGFPLFRVHMSDTTQAMHALLDSVLQQHAGFKLWYSSLYEEHYFVATGHVPLSAAEIEKLEERYRRDVVAGRRL